MEVEEEAGGEEREEEDEFFQPSVRKVELVSPLCHPLPVPIPRACCWPCPPSLSPSGALQASDPLLQMTPRHKAVHLGVQEGSDLMGLS